MGLDSVELVMEIEDAFDLCIPDDDAAAMRTPRDVIDFVWAAVQQRAGGDALAHAFADLCNALREVTGREAEWSTSTELPAILPIEGGREQWDMLASRIRVLPRFERPGLVVKLGCALPVAVGLAIGVW